MPIDRRRFLGALSLAPAALAACAGASPSPRGGAPARAGAPAAAPDGGAAAAVRDFPLPREAEPALVFRAAAARPGER